MGTSFHKWFVRLSFLIVILSFVVTILGAYVRLSNAGLGCPDWPGCYGELTVPSHDEISPDQYARPLEAPKAWKEMTHRYFAGSLGLLILFTALLSLKIRTASGRRPCIPWVLLGIVIFQALLGRWTVTLKLHPSIVMGHLMGGLATLSLAWWMALRGSGLFLEKNESIFSQSRLSNLKPWAGLALVVLIVQIMLGGWTSANYAALACPDFPTCQGQWWPPMDFEEGFNPLREFGHDYEFGVLDNGARVAIHLIHRLGAVVAFLIVGLVALLSIRRGKGTAARKVGVGVLIVLFLQLALGVSNIQTGLHLPVAVAHNGGAALLLLSLIALNHLVMASSIMPE